MVIATSPEPAHSHRATRYNGLIHLSRKRIVHHLIVGILAGLGLALPSASHAAEGTVSFEVMTPETALAAAQAALENCRESDYQVAVAVVDRFGGIQVVLRDLLAGARTVNTAVGKARTAVGFRTNTSDMVPVTAMGQPAAGIRHLPGVVVVGGGVIIEAAGSLVGGIGVSGAPGGELDDVCALAGIEAIEDLLEF
jgi:uncharacterized protein GlcG (DUF336 family)